MAKKRQGKRVQGLRVRAEKVLEARAADKDCRQRVEGLVGWKGWMGWRGRLEKGLDGPNAPRGNGQRQRPKDGTWCLMVQRMFGESKV